LITVEIRYFSRNCSRFNKIIEEKMIGPFDMTNEIHWSIDSVNKGLIYRSFSLFSMATFVQQPNLTEGLSLIGWRLKRNAEILARKNDVDFECEVEPSSTSYAAIDDNNDLCLEVDAINLNSSSQDDYDPYEVFMRVHGDRANTGGRHRTPLSLLASQSTTISNNTRHYNFADDDTPIKYPLAIGFVDRRVKQTQNVRVLFRRRSVFFIAKHLDHSSCSFEYK